MSTDNTTETRDFAAELAAMDAADDERAAAEAEGAVSKLAARLEKATGKERDSIRSKLVAAREKIDTAIGPRGGIRNLRGERLI